MKKLSISEYFNLYKKINEKKRGIISRNKTVKIAILTSFTSKGIKEVLNLKCNKNGIFVDFYEVPFVPFWADGLIVGVKKLNTA